MKRSLAISFCLVFGATGVGAVGVGGPATPVHEAPLNALAGQLLDLGGTGEPGHAYVIAVSLGTGPSPFLPGLDLDLGLDYLGQIVGSGLIDGAGNTGSHPAFVPLELLGETGYSQMVTFALAPIADVQKSTALATEFVDDLCTPAVQMACIAAGNEPCTPGTGSAACGPLIEPCTPEIIAGCQQASLIPCTPGTGQATCQGPDPCTFVIQQICAFQGLEPCSPGSSLCGPPIEPCTPEIIASCLSAVLIPCTPGTGESTCQGPDPCTFVIQQICAFNGQEPCSPGSSECGPFISDARHKRIEGRSNAVDDLARLKRIEITDYTLIDPAFGGTGPQKKVIAQQLESVYPQAVRPTTLPIPEFYRDVKIEDSWIQLATDLVVGDRVRLIAGERDELFEVLEVEAARFRTALASESGSVFVYGREVDDMRTVDYTALSTLNISATQALAEQVEAQAALLSELRSELERVRAECKTLREQWAEPSAVLTGGPQ